jgi:hypothetical protein
LKKFVTSILCLLILLNTGGYYFVYLQAQIYFKQIAFGRINEYIPESSLTVFKVIRGADFAGSQKEIERINEHEISFRGNMYDIYKEEVSGDTLVLYCLSDENEDKLEQAFSEYINLNVIDYFNASVKSVIVSIIKTAILPIIFDFKNPFSINLITSNSPNNLLNVIIDVSDPPPRIT